jgi:SAM-dependent methyltransferase
MKKSEYIQHHSNILKNKTVVDLACHTGESTDLILKAGAQQVYAVEIRNELIDQAKKQVSGNVNFILGDITNSDVICPLIQKSQTITCFGVLYHLFDHFRFFSNILKPNIEHVLIETVFGPETANPEMFWGFETTDQILHGWAQNCKIIPNGTPNLSWIINCARIFEFDCDWVQCYGGRQTVDRKHLTHEDYIQVKGDSWPAYSDIINEQFLIPEFVQNEIDQMLNFYPKECRRMILRLYNTNTIDSTPLDIKNICAWPL